MKLIQRPEHLRADTTPMNDVLLHTAKQIEADFYLQTHSTNPLLRAETISTAIESFTSNYPAFDSLFSVTRLQSRLWDGLARPINHNPAILLRTQDLPPVFEENSCLYLFARRTLEARHNRIGDRPMLFPIDRREAIDIDEEIDFRIAELMYLERTPAQGVCVMRYKVVISAPYMQPIVDRFLGLFKDEGCELLIPTVNERLSENELLKIIGDVHGVICGDDRFTRKVLLAAKNLRVISKWGTGIDSIDRDACDELGIRVCNTPNAFTLPVSDSVFAIMLAFARRIPWQNQQMKSGEWIKQPGVSLAECTLGIIGCGNIGKAVARRAAAFGMTILGNDIKEMPDDFVREANIRMVGKDELLRLADFVSIHCDLNATSVHLMSDKQFSMMKPSARADQHRARPDRR